MELKVGMKFKATRDMITEMLHKELYKDEIIEIQNIIGNTSVCKVVGTSKENRMGEILMISNICFNGTELTPYVKLEVGMKFKLMMEFRVGSPLRTLEKNSILEVIDINRCIGFDYITCNVYSENGSYICSQSFTDKFFSVNLNASHIKEVKECPKQEKTNRLLYKDSIIEYNIDGKYIKFSIEKNGISLWSLIKILLKETNIVDFKYTRISPYKITFKKDEKDYVYSIRFIDVKDNCLAKEQEIIKINREAGDTVSTGKYRIFIPDLLELCVYNKILKKISDEKFIVSINLNTSDMREIEYIHKKPSRKKLERMGYTVPRRYEDIEVEVE